jgi:hypothetical protein
MAKAHGMDIDKKVLDKENSFIYNLCEISVLFIRRSSIHWHKLSLIAF